MFFKNDIKKNELKAILSQQDDQWVSEFISQMSWLKDEISDYREMFDSGEISVDVFLEIIEISQDFSDAASLLIDASMEPGGGSVPSNFIDTENDLIEGAIRFLYEDSRGSSPGFRADKKNVRPTEKSPLDSLRPDESPRPTKLKDRDPVSIFGDDGLKELVESVDIEPKSGDPERDYSNMFLSDEIKIRRSEAETSGLPWFETESEYMAALQSGDIDRKDNYSGPWRVKQNRQKSQRKKDFGTKRSGEFKAPPWLPKDTDSLSSKYEEALLSGKNVDQTTFYSVFSGIGEDAKIFDVTALTDEGEVRTEVSLKQESWAKVKEAVLLKINSILKDSQKEGVSIMNRNNSDTRMRLTSELDDLVYGIKQWDSGNAYKKTQLRERGADVSGLDSYNLSDLFLDQSSDYFINISTIVNILVFPWTASEQLTRRKIHKASRDNDEYYNLFVANVEDRISDYILKSFDVKNNSFYRNNKFSRGALQRVSTQSTNRLIHQTIQRSKVKVKHWTIIECTVCGESIRWNKLNDSDNKEEWNEYAYDEYSLFREDKSGNRSLISIGDLEGGWPSGSESFPGPNPFSETEATWSQIQRMISSGDKNIHAEGVIRRANALKLLGAKRLSKQISVFSRRYKCPYQSGKCKAIINPISAMDSAIASPDSFDVNKVNISRTTGDSNSAERALGTALDNGGIDQDTHDKILSKLRQLSSGGYKFSNSFFRCPHKIDVDPGDSIMDYKDYDYLAVPHVGPATRDKVSSGLIHPPATGIAQDYSLTDGTSAYLVCGALTSLSSFVRQDSDTDGNSTPSLSKVLKGVYGSKSPDAAAELIEHMIRYGVDINDLIPFVYELGESFDSGDKDTERFSKLSGLLSMAMSRSVKDSSRDVVGPVALMCKHGHVFTVNQSLGFARTHMGTRLSQSASKGRSVGPRGAIRWSTISNSKILSQSGIDNFNEAVKLKILHDHSASGERVKQELINYSDWNIDNFKASDSKRVSYPGPNGDGMYSAGGYSMSNNIWNYSQTTDPVIRKDKGTEEEVDINKDLRLGVGAVSDNVSTSEGKTITLSDKNVGNIAAGSMPSVDIATADALDKRIEIMSSTLQTLLSNVIAWRDRSFSRGVIDKGQVQNQRICCDEDLPFLRKSSEYLFAELFDRGVFEVSFVNGGERSATSKDSFYESLLSRLVSEFEALTISRFKGLDLNIARNYYEYGKESIKRILEADILTIIDKIVLAYSDSEVDYIDWADDALGSLGVSGYVSGFIRTSPHSNDISDRLFPSSSSKRGSEQTEWAERSMLCSSAHYIADQISNLYREYMTEGISDNYIGFYVGLDLSNIDNIFRLQFSDLGSVTSSIDSINDSSPIIRIREMRDSDPEEKGTPDLSTIEGQALNHSVLKMIESMRSMTTKMMTSIPSGIERASTSQRYLAMSNEYILNGLNEKIDLYERFSSGDITDPKDLEGFNSSEAKEDATVAKYILDSLYDVPPVTTISLSRDSVYYTGESHLSGPPLGAIFSVPIYRAYVAENKKDSTKEYVVVGRDNTGFWTFAKGDNPPADSISIDNDQVGLGLVEELLSRGLIDSGHTLFRLPASKYKIGRPKDVSMIYHPNTYPILDDEGKEVGFRNDSIGLDTTSGFSFGRIGKRVEKDSVFPPSPKTHVGPVGMPLNLRGSPAAIAKLSAISITDSHIPVEIPVPGTDSYRHFDMTYLLSRDKSNDQAFVIMGEIDKLYNAMTEEVSRILEDRSIDSADRQARADDVSNMYKQLIADKHVRYKDLPLHVLSSSCASKKKGVMYEADGKPWIPMVDWMTAHKIITEPQYGPEFGGHSFWGIEDSGTKAEAISSLVNFVSKTNNIEGLAKVLNDSLSSLRPIISGAPTIYPPSHPKAGKPYLNVTEEDLFMGQGWIIDLVRRHQNLDSSSIEQRLLENSLIVIKKITKYNFVVPVSDRSSSKIKKHALASVLGSGVRVIDLNTEDSAESRVDPWGIFAEDVKGGIQALLKKAGKSMHDGWKYEDGMLYPIAGGQNTDGSPNSYIRMQTASSKGKTQPVATGRRISIDRPGQFTNEAKQTTLERVPASEWIRRIQGGEAREITSRIVDHMSASKPIRGYSFRLSEFIRNQIIKKLMEKRSSKSSDYRDIKKFSEKYKKAFNILQRRKLIERIISLPKHPKL